MNEFSELDSINKMYEHQENIDGNKHSDEVLVSKKRCVWCGQRLPLSDMVTIDGVNLCRVCTEKVLSKVERNATISRRAK